MRETTSGIIYRVDDLTPPWQQKAVPVILQHGIGTDMDIWAEWVPILAVHRPVIRLDMRGWGRSADVPVGKVSLSRLADDLWEVADCVGAALVHLMGESLGGTIALTAAIAKPERTASLNMSNATFKGADLGEVDGWDVQFSDGVEAWSERMMRNRFGADIQDSPALQWFAKTQRASSPEVAIAMGRMLAATDLSEGLANLDRPISLTLPDSSPFIPLEHGVAATTLNPRTRLRVVQGARHGLPFSHAKAEATLLQKTLSELERTAKG